MPDRSTLIALATALALSACASPDRPEGAQTADAPPAAAASTAANECTLADGAALTGLGIAGIEIREDAAEVRRRCNVVGDTTLTLEGQPQPAMRIALNGDTIVAEVVNDEIWRIRITSPGPMTSDSIRVGTPANRLAQIPGASVSAGEGNYFVLLPEHCGLSFGLEGLPTRARPWTLAELASQPDSARVGIILITGSCHENGGTRRLWNTAG